MTSDPWHKNDLLFLPLGGAGEIGMNLNLYHYAGQWLMIDLGITFGDERTPGIDVITPDPKFIVERRAQLQGLVLTHAHEDHIGAVPYLWPQLRCPLYATPFTASVLRRKLREAGLEKEVVIQEIPLSGKFTVGAFELELITLTHSIPEPNAVVVRTPAGTVLHTGDWKLDPTPLIGATADEAALRRVGDEGVLALIGDSTNVFVEGESGSENDVREALDRLLPTFRNRVAVTCFASNIARLETIAKVAARHGRHAALVGRSLWRMDEAARENGYLTDLPPFVREDDIGYLPKDAILLICTGSQGEPRSALARIARHEHAHIVLERGDAVVFSSRQIPGNEKSIASLQNMLARDGIDIITDADHPIHVSGHPARDELAEMYRWIRPRLAIPVHGEERHLHEHAKLAESCQVPKAVVPRNGTIIRLAPGPAQIIAETHAGRLGLDGVRLIPMDHGAVRDRHKLMHSGAALVTVVVDPAGNLLGQPRLTAPGLLEAETDQSAITALEQGVAEALEDLPAPLRRDDTALEEKARLTIRRAFFQLMGKKPRTTVHVVRVRGKR